MIQSSNCFKKVYFFIKKELLLEKGDNIIISVSGGIDSTVLLYVLAEISKNIDFKFCVAHINHGLRGNDSDLDEKFVKNLCEKFKIPFYSKKLSSKDFDSIKGSVQEKARVLRLQALLEIKEKIHANKIVTGHNKNDNVETILFRLARGTSLRGLTGIRPQNGFKIRPLLCVSRDEISEFARDNNISFREDYTNNTDKYSRNKIRHHIVPQLLEINSNAIDNISRTSDVLYSQMSAMIDSDINAKVFEKKSYGYETEFAKLAKNKNILAEKLHSFIVKIFSEEKSFDKVLSQEVLLDLVDHILLKDSFCFHLPNNFILVKSCRKILITKNEIYEKLFDSSFSENFVEIKNSKNLKFKFWQQGDLLNSKSIKIYFNKFRIPVYLRRLIPLILNDENKIIAIAGYKGEQANLISYLFK